MNVDALTTMFQITTNLTILYYEQNMVTNLTVVLRFNSILKRINITTYF